MAPPEQVSRHWRGHCRPDFKARVSSSAGFPEFRTRNNSTITYVEEEGLAFENLSLVLRNYVRHGFDRIIVTDLRDPILRQVPRRFSRYQYILITLWIADDQVLKNRVLDETRSSGYRDWKEALQLNRAIRARKLMKNEVRFDSSQNTVGELVEEVVRMVHHSV